MIGIECRWECPSCGNILRTDNPFWNTDLRKKIAEPKGCGCGRKTKFSMLSFKECEFKVIPAGFEVVKTKEE